MTYALTLALYTLAATAVVVISCLAFSGYAATNLGKLATPAYVVVQIGVAAAAVGLGVVLFA